MASYLIIGCGYLGQRVAQQLLQAGHSVFATTRKPQRADDFREQGIKPVLCDVTQPATLSLPATEGVVHCVGLDRSAGVPMRTVYVEGLQHVLAALSPSVPFVHVSSTSVYGQTTGEEVTEDSPTVPLEGSGQIVLEAEQLLRQVRPEAVILRFAGLYGPGRLLRQAALLRGEPLIGFADKWLNLIHVDDGASAVVQTLTASLRGETMNISDGEPVTRRAFYTLLAQLLKAPPAAFEDPPAPVSASEQVNRRISNRRMRERLNIPLQYPTYTVGLQASVPGH